MPRENTIAACAERIGLNLGGKLTKISQKILPSSPEKTYRDGAAALRRANRKAELNGICFEYTHPSCRDQTWDWETPRRRSAVDQLIGSTSTNARSSISSTSSSASSNMFSLNSYSSGSFSSAPVPPIDLDFEVPVLDPTTNHMMLKTGVLRQSALFPSRQ